MRGESELRGIADRVLRASLADQTEVTVTAHESALTRFASSAIHQNVLDAGIEVRVRAIVGTRTGVMAENSSGYAERTGVDASTIDVDAVGREAVDKALRSRDPIPLDPGAYTVILEPYAVGTMIDYLSYIGLGAMALQEERSFMN